MKAPLSMVLPPAAGTASACVPAPAARGATTAAAHVASLALLAHAVAVAGIAQRVIAVGGAGAVAGRGFIRPLAMGAATLLVLGLTAPA
ncbi:hypothetical protein, partial [Achromobacter spanius]|uniref:hypothetical protein n=1 Tax=Achromobacter spanius TaxID=217203 RepID=UPI003A8E0166